MSGIQKPYRAFFAFLLLTGCGSPTDKQEDKIHQVESSLVSQVYIEGDTLWTIESRMAHYGVPGVSLAVIDQGKIAWVKTYGVMNKERKEPVTTETLFQAGSISKPVAAYGAMRIAASGKFDPEANINNYLKSWHLPENEFTQKQPVHLKHILSHTGGLTVHGFPGYSPDQELPSLVQVLDGVPPANTPAIRVDKLPGEGFRYSGGGYTIMQQMLIDIEGKPFPEIMQEQVLGPIKMIHSTYDQPLPPDWLPRAATGYVPDGTMTKGERHTYPEMAAAGLWTTSEDLARFAIDIQRSWKGEPDAVLGQKTAALMLTPYIVDFQGLGLAIDKFGEEVYFGHGGWDEGFSSEMIASRDKGYGVVVLTNANQPPFISELMRAVALTYHWDNYVPTYKPLPISGADMAKVVGRYRYDPDGVSTIFEKNGKLYYQYTGMPKPMEMFKVSDSTYVRHERTAQIQIVKNPADNIDHLIFRSGNEPVSFDKPRMEEGEKVPLELFLSGDYAGARDAYRNYIKANPEDRTINEQGINRRGYDLLSEKKMQQAKEMFRINMFLFPLSANVYDSYAEACMLNGDKDEAIQYYKKTLSLQPDNPQARQNLEKLQSNK